MSYNSPVNIATNLGVVRVGANISGVISGFISLAQDISCNGNPTFSTVTSTGTVTSNGSAVVEFVTGTAGPGISITSATTTGPAATFTVNNTGVTSIIAGPGTTVSTATGDVTVSLTGTGIMNTTFVSGTTYAATTTDVYIGVSNVLPVMITLPAGIPGGTYIIKDEYGAGFGGITVTPNRTETIDNAATYVITVPLASITVVFSGTGWYVI